MHTNEPVTEVVWNEVLMSLIFEARRRMWLPNAGENEAETLLFTLGSLQRLRIAHAFVEKARQYPLPFINALIDFGLVDFDGYVPRTDQVEFNRIAAEHGVKLAFNVPPPEPEVGLIAMAPEVPDDLREARRTMRAATDQFVIEFARRINGRGPTEVSAETFARRLFDLLG